MYSNDDDDELLLTGRPVNQFFQAPPMERLRQLQTMQAGERSIEEDALLKLLQKRPDIRETLVPDTQSKGTPPSWNPFKILSDVLGGQQQ
jgi:hypothetical protein